MRTRTRLAGDVLTATALTVAGCASEDASGPTTPTSSAPSTSPTASEETGRSVAGTALRLTVNGTEVEGTMVDNATAREFAALLPLTIDMSDMLGREAYGGGLPGELTDDAPRRTDYEVGQLVYWPPTNGLAVYYRHAGSPVPEPGMIPLATITDGVNAFDLSETGETEVTIEIAD